MSQRELINEIRQLSIIQQVEILKEIVRRMNEELTLERTKSSPSRKEVAEKIFKSLCEIGEAASGFGFEFTKTIRPANNNENSKRGTARLSQRLLGVLEFDGELPTDDDIRNARSEYLMEKYR